MVGKRVWSALVGCALSMCFAHPVFADASATLTFADEGITASQEGSGYTIEGTTLTINEAGTYELTGTCANGSVIVDEGVDGAVLVLRDLSLSSSTTAPIVVKGSSKVQLSLEGASALTDAEDPANETSTDAEVAAAFKGAAVKVEDGASVTFDGKGSLAVKGNAKNGIKGGSQAALTFKNGTYDVDAQSDGITSDGSLVFVAGTYDIAAGGSGVHGGTSVVVGSENGLARDPEVTIERSNVGIEAGTVDIYSGKTWIAAQGDGINTAGDGQVSAEHNISIYGGDLYVDCLGDGLESGGGLYLYGGRQTILSQAMGGQDSPFDASGVILVKGSTLYAAGTNPTGLAPSSESQSCYRWSSSKQAGTVTTIKNGGTVLYSERLPRSINYLLYSNPTLTTAPRLFVNDAFDACKSNAWAHSWSDAQPAQDADGIAVSQCSACGKTEYKTIEAHESNSVNMYRLYNPNSGEHFYTAKLGERDALVNVGWKYEGVGWVAPISSQTPVYRLYNRFAGDHHYTTNAAERDALVASNWTDEGIGWYSDDAQGVALYRQYNPHATTGTHNYTTNAGERDALIALGWNDEGIGWYGVATDSGSEQGDDPEPNPQDGTEDPATPTDPTTPTDPATPEDPTNPEDPATPADPANPTDDQAGDNTGDQTGDNTDAGTGDQTDPSGDGQATQG